MSQQFEIELRGLLSKDQFNQLSDTFSHEAEFAQNKNRVLIDYSTFLEGQGIKERQKDIRLRSTNGQPEIIVKLGSWGGSEQREELSVLTHKDSFDTLVKIFNALGYNKGVLCVRNSAVYNYDGVEFALVEVPGHSYYFEAEKVVSSESEKDKARDDVAAVCARLGLSIFSDVEFYNYIEQLNKEANEVFDFDKDFSEGYFKKRFSI